MLNHRTHEITKSNLPKYKGGKFHKVVCGCRFLEREIEGPVKLFGPEERKISCMDPNLQI
jgi:hypothetical protein